MTTQEILQQCTVEGLVIKLPSIVLDRKEYQGVKKSLERIGGKWKGGKIEGFVFEQDPTELLQEVASGKQRNLKKEYQFFATPRELAHRMAGMVKINSDTRILEPSAGDGALIQAVRNTWHGDINVDCFETMDLNRKKLQELPGANLIGTDFLKAVEADEMNLIRGHYDVIIANPPFTNNQDIDHIRAMYECLKPGGTLLTLSSLSWTFGSNRKQQDFKVWLDELEAWKEEIPEGTFKDAGTSVKTILIKLEKSSIKLTDNLIHLTDNPIHPFSPDSFQEDANEFVKNRLSNKKVRRCRVCGCTDVDCSQCIEKTGEPCHWVEEDLCSACVEETKENIQNPDKILEDMLKGEKEIYKSLRELKRLTYKNDDMNFFEQLAAIGHVDLTIRILQKNDKLTLNIMPGAKSASIQPILVTGTPEELDAEFFQTIAPGVMEISGLITNLEQVKEDVKKESGEKKSGQEKAAIATKKVEKKEEKKLDKPTITEPALFD